MAYSNRVREAEIAVAVTKYLYDVGGVASIKQIRRALPHYISLADADRLQSPTRPREELWEQQVRNIVCHRKVDGNPINEGTIAYSPRRLKLVDGPQGDLFAPEVLK